MTLAEVIDTLQTWIRNADDEYDREEMGRVAGLKEALHEIKKIEQCEDCISRQELKKRFREKCVADCSCCKYWRGDDWCEIINELLSVQPKPKTGHWEWVQYDYNPKLGNWHCSECRCVVVECVDKNEKGGIPLYKYCPQCGTKMVEPQESEDKCKKCEYYINPDYTRCHTCKAESEETE